MLIPLDYYRILGVPVGSSGEQLSQAYHDRSLQLPRSEYSDQAIAARKHLLEEAYSVLSDPQQRTEYDAKLLEPLQESSPPEETPSPEAGGQQAESATAWLEIRSEHFVGALLILQELGEYELVLKLGQPALETDGSFSEAIAQSGSREDIVLTLVLSCLELGRERWQRGEYELAATAGQMGQELLMREGLFANLQSEINADLDKLRPYRILELLELEEEHCDRSKGIQLLKEMLKDRHGIDGMGKDGSGLTIDDFLRFIQQLRSYLTVIEQQEIFEAEAKRPSAVAAYLAVYALIARGFAHRKPVFIVQAQELLNRLTQRQDVYLEYAVCAMLLGQTKEANLVLERSQEQEPLAFIRKHSQGDPDLLPGLCLYGERWLQAEVFAHFKDLAAQQASLKEYFADEKVQIYLEKLAEEKHLPSLENEAASAFTPAQNRQNGLEQQQTIPVASPEQVQYQSERTTATLTATVPRASQSDDATFGRNSDESGAVPLRGGDRLQFASESVDTAERELDPSKQVVTTWLPHSLQKEAQRRQRRLTQRSARTTNGGGASPPARTYPLLEGIKRLRPKKANSKLVKSLLLLGSVGLLGLGIVGLVRSFSSVNRETELQIGLNESPIPIPSLEAKPEAVASGLTNEAAQQVIQSWLSAKSKAFGQDHQIDQLSKILSPSLLSLWRNRAQAFAGENAYREYQHSVDVRSVEMAPQNSDQAKVEAMVKEVAQHYQNGAIQTGMSYSDDLLVRYDLVRQGEQWLIENITILK